MTLRIPLLYNMRLYNEAKKAITIVLSCFISKRTVNCIIVYGSANQ